VKNLNFETGSIEECISGCKEYLAADSAEKDHAA
jgi:hypothetical protein